MQEEAADTAASGGLTAESRGRTAAPLLGQLLLR